MGWAENIPRDGNENFKNAIDYEQNNNFARAFRFFVHFFAATTTGDVKMPDFMFYGGRKQATKNKTFFLFLKDSSHSFAKVSTVSWNNPDEDWKPANHFLLDVFPCLRHPCIVSSLSSRVVVLFTFYRLLKLTHIKKLRIEINW